AARAVGDEGVTGAAHRDRERRVEAARLGRGHARLALRRDTARLGDGRPATDHVLAPHALEVPVRVELLDAAAGRLGDDDPSGRGRRADRVPLGELAAELAAVHGVLALQRDRADLRAGLDVAHDHVPAPHAQEVAVRIELLDAVVQIADVDVPGAVHGDV